MITSFAARIQGAYERLGHQLGWRFLASPAHTLSPETRLAFVGLNPGGSRYEAPLASVEEGNAYRVESWGPNGGPNALQTQVRLMYRELAKQSDKSLTAAELMDGTLAANFCPFRSPSWSCLPNKAESVDFSRELWRGVLDLAEPRAVICFGEVAGHLARLMEENGSRPVGQPEVRRVEWGDITYSLSRYESSRTSTLLVRLPHLSRFRIFGRPQSRSAVTDFTTAIAEQLA